MLAFVAALVALYCALSWWFLRHPLFRVAPLPFPTIHIAHRGGGGDHPENTLRAFRAASRLGHVDVLELDVRWTLDRQVVLHHDPCFADGVAVKDVPLAGAPARHGEPLCTLEQLLDACPDAAISLDFKVHGDDSLIHAVHAMFAGRARLHKLVWGSFDEATRVRCETLYPAVPTFCSLRGTAKLYLLFLVGFLPFVPVRERMLCAVLLHEHEARLLAQRLVWVGWLAAVCSPERLLGLLTGLIEHPAFVLHLQRRGMAVSFWTANTEEHVERVRRSGSRSIITDHPAQALHRLLM